MTLQSKRVIVIGGPTGSGESTITNALVAQFPNFTRLVTATTRPMREGEVDGVDYHFFSKEQFLREIESGNILEHTYISNRDIYYGSYKPDLEKKLSDGKVVIVNPDIIGAKFYKQNFGALTIFIEPQSIETLATRLKKRNPDMSEMELGQRLENARQELEQEKPFYDVIIRNEDGKLSEAIEKAAAVIKKFTEA
jgi:guanylate kinase